jgi:uncharacterized membrane-anchored protein
MNLVLRLVALIVCFFAAPLHAQTPTALDGVNWQKGPSIGKLGSLAEIRVPEGYVFVGANDTRILMEAMQNPATGRELGFVAPAGMEWFVVFEFDESGYVKDDEKTSLDADAILASLKRGSETANKERQRRGWPILTITGWQQQPHFDDLTKNLEWAIKAESEGQLVVNYNTRLLGRTGVMRVTFVDSPANLSATLPKFKNVLSGFQFQKGYKYAEYRQGDKVAQYGLGALIVGGASAAAVKSGAFKGLWKLLAVGGVAILGFFKRLFSGKTE